MFRSYAFAAALLLPCGAFTAHAGPVGTVTSALTGAGCARLAQMRVPATAIGLPTRGAIVTKAEVVAAAGSGADAIGGYCLVSGNIKPIDATAPVIEFQVALPSQWNEKALMIGGGGFNGTIPKLTTRYYNAPAEVPGPLAHGYAVLGGDGGHKAPVQEPGSFLMNDEARRNWMGDSLKKTRDTAVVIIRAAYGKMPSKTYFIGGSTGGREALMVAGRWPQDWDGVVALYPARAATTQTLGAMVVNRAFAAPGAFLSPAKRDILFRGALAACDRADGVADGLISDVRGCNASFRPETALVDGVPLRCPGGTDTGDTCLSDAQLAALAKVNRPLRFGFPIASGEHQFPGYNVYTSDTGIPKASPLQQMVSFLAFGATPPTFPATATMSLSAGYADNFIRYGIVRDPSFNPLTLDPEHPGSYAARISELSAVDASDHDLAPFAAKGGKVLMMHGTSDMIVSPRYSEEYFEYLRRTMGAAKLDSFMRFYEVPGLGHALSTNFGGSWDYVGALERWVEQRVDPDGTQIVVDTTGVPGRTRPLCRYPAWPKYTGKGDVNVASSFTCFTSR